MHFQPQVVQWIRANPPTEPTKPHDAFAVEILHGTAKLGYVPRFCNRHVNRLLWDSVQLACEVERFDPQAPPWEAVSVRIHPTKPAETLI
jgi:hypothetical protein